MAVFLDNCAFLPTAGGTTNWTYSARIAGYNNPADAGVTNGKLYKYYAFSADRSQWEIGEGAYNTGTGVLARTTVLFNSAQTGTVSPGQSGAGSKINFSTVPTVVIIAIKEDLLAIDEANAFTAPQKEQARSNLGILATRYWSGYQHSNNVGTPNTKIDVGAGVCRDSTDAVNIVSSSGTIDCGTTGANGLDAGSLANSTWYYTFTIAKDDGTEAKLASTSPTAPTLPATYTKFRRVGSFKTNASAQILPFHHVNNKWWLDTSPRDYNATPTLNTVTAVTLSVPRVLGIVAKLALTAFPASASATTVYAYPTFLPSTARTGNAVITYNTTQGSVALVETQADASGQINIYVTNGSAVNSTVVIDLAGWQDDL